MPLDHTARADYLARYASTVRQAQVLDALLHGAEPVVDSALVDLPGRAAPPRNWLLVGIDLSEPGLGALFDARASRSATASPLDGLAVGCSTRAFVDSGRALVRVELGIDRPRRRRVGLVLDTTDDDQALYAIFDAINLPALLAVVLEHVDRRPFTDTRCAGLPVIGPPSPDAELARALAGGDRAAAAALAAARPHGSRGLPVCGTPVARTACSGYRPPEPARTGSRPTARPDAAAHFDHRRSSRGARRRSCGMTPPASTTRATAARLEPQRRLRPAQLTIVDALGASTA